MGQLQGCPIWMLLDSVRLLRQLRKPKSTLKSKIFALIKVTVEVVFWARHQ